MARKVYVSSDISHDEALIGVSERSGVAALMWPWLLTAFDDWGRAEAHPLRLKAKVWPLLDIVTTSIVDEALALYAEHGLIALYEDAGARYMAIDEEKWRRWQTHIRWDRKSQSAESLCPPPPGTIPAPAGQLRDTPGYSTPSPSPSPSSTSNEVGEPTIFQALYEFWLGKRYEPGEAKRLTKGERGKLNAAAKQARDAGITPAEIAERGTRYVRDWPGMERSPTGLLNHWTRFDASADPPAPFDPANCTHPEDRRAELDGQTYCGACGYELPERTT